MKLTLAGLKKQEYNGVVVELCVLEDPVYQRICVELPGGKRISVPYSGVDSSTLELDTCAICTFPCFPSYCSTTACRHTFHTTCLMKWRESARTNVEAPGTRCPLCRSYQGTAGTVPWNELKAQEIILLALGAIFQNYASQNGRREPSETEELAFVLTCTRKCIENKQADYPHLQRCLDAFNAEKTFRLQKALMEAIKRQLVVHVFYDQTVDAGFVSAINAWFITLLRV